MIHYPHLMNPMPLRSITLRNRIVMGAMHTRLETLDRPNERLAAFYAARAQGEVGLILTAGYSPSELGVFEPGAPLLNDVSQLEAHRAVTDAVHQVDSKIALQIVHAGRYAKLEGCVSPSGGKARINSFESRALSTDEVWQTIEDFAHTAELARQGGYDGVEIMGSEGYLINQFTAAFTNQRSDEFGGNFDARLRFPVEIVSAIRRRLGPDFLIVYRISAIDLIKGGMTGKEVAELGRRVEGAGADIINTGIGWHESAVPTIAAAVPRSAWSFAIANVKKAVGIPVIASNRINTPDVGEAILAQGIADMVSMARPLLADPDFAKKTREGRPEDINSCIACNQACLDRIFTERTATCLVNPRAGREIEFVSQPVTRPKRIAVVGGGPAGLAFAINARQRGHEITLYESSRQLGGQLNMAKVVPGKSEFHEMLRYFNTQIQKLGVIVRLGKPAEAAEIAAAGYDEIVVATGVRARVPAVRGIDHPKVLSYIDVLASSKAVGQRVAIIGAGGIGFDVAEFLVGNADEALVPEEFLQTWGVDSSLSTDGGLSTSVQHHKLPRRTVFMFQRTPESLGKGLGKSTGWILKSKLKRERVSMIAGASYEAIDDQGLHYSQDGKAHVLAVDNVILCAGQESDRTLYDQLTALGVAPRVIGGADVASELDALRAIDQATRLAVDI